MEKFLTIKELAEHLGLKEKTLYGKVSRNEIPYYKIGRLIKFKASDIDEWIASNRRGPAELDVKAIIKKVIAKHCYS